MGILDRFTSLIARRDHAKVDPKGPLGLLPGDSLSHYDTRFQVVGTRVQMRGERLVYQYRLRSEDDAIAVLVAGGDVADGFALERVRTDVSVAWDKDQLPGPEEEEFRLADQGNCGLQHFGDTGVGESRDVRYRIFEDEETGQLLSLEDFGGTREIRIGDPVFEGELTFHGGAGPGNDRAWDTDAEQCDESAASEVEDDIARGSPMAAAMALEGRFAAGTSDPSTYAESDPTEFDDAEWGDAEDVVDEHSMLAKASSFQFSESAGWLEPTLFVEGAHAEAPPEPEDDWLTRSQASSS